MDDVTASTTRALTLIACLKRLQNGGDAPPTAPDSPSLITPVPQSTLTIHLVGADHREGNSALETLSVFDAFFEHLVVEDQRYHTLRLVLVGPNVAQGLHRISHSSVHQQQHRAQTPTNSTMHVAVSYFVGGFDDYYTEKETYIRPDLAVCFNAGIWGYDQWLPTLRLLVHTIQTPLLITSYNGNEASDDEDILDEDVGPARWYWRAEKNPFGSLELRSTRNDIGSVLRENDFWMCVGPDRVPLV